MSKNCWDIVRCPFRDTDPEASRCPAYRLQMACWEFDWARYYGRMCERPGTEEWRTAMLARCRGCQVYASHREQMDRVLDRLLRA